jgi:beta-phosphoglucomutase-like phosphatase (HAD superfamily)
VTCPAEPCLLFDIDGTLVDTDKVHIVAFNEVISRYGVHIDHETYRHKVSGRMNNEVLADLLPDATVAEHIAIGHEKEALFRAMVGDIEPITGLLDLLDWADAAALRYAAVTNAPRENAELVLRSLKATERFAALVLADDLEHAKPHPLPYLTGLEHLNGMAERSVAFEDSKSGVLSASTAGLGVIGLTTSLDPQTLVAHGATLTAPDYLDDELRRFIKDRTGKG